MYPSYQMLSNLTPREMTAIEQREGDEQRGQVAAALARWSHRVVAQVHALAIQPARHRRQQAAFRKACPAPRRAPAS
jgi:hypothetical protein